MTLLKNEGVAAQRFAVEPSVATMMLHEQKACDIKKARLEYRRASFIQEVGLFTHNIKLNFGIVTITKIDRCFVHT